jgi:plastocyanin
MRGQGITIGLSLAVAVLAACSSSTAPNGGGGGGGGGGSSNTITASSQTSGGGAYGGGGNYYFSPTPDTVSAGTQVTYQFGSVTHNVHFDAVANAPDSIPASMNTSVNRTFTTAGTYNYHCSIHNIAGVVVVK